MRCEEAMLEVGFIFADSGADQAGRRRSTSTIFRIKS